MKTAIGFIVCFLCANLLAQPTTAPATETLMKGDVPFTVPDGWKLDGKANNDRLAKLSHVDPTAVMVINVDPQESVLPDSGAAKIGQMLTKKIRDNAAKGEFELLMPPKTEPDDRFFLRIHHRYKKGNETGDQLQLYRVIGKNLVAVATTAFTDSPDEAKRIFDDAEKTMLSVGGTKAQSNAPGHAAVKSRPATRPTVLPQAKIVFNGPGGWSEQTNDNTTGIVATYHDPVEQFNTIVISVRPLPPEAKKDPKMRDALVEEIVNGEKASFKFDGANVVGETETVKDSRFLKKVRIRYEKADSKIQVTSRIRRVGDAVVSVAMASVEANANDVDKLADEVAVTLRAK